MKSIFGIIFCPLMLCALSYDVEFVGVTDPLCMKAIKNGSDLTKLHARPPASVNGLRYRIESDIPGLQKILRAFAFYDASLTYTIQLAGDYAHVTMIIDAGASYKLADYSIVYKNWGEPDPSLRQPPRCTIQLEQLGLHIGKDPAWSTTIVNAELQLLAELSRCGYPLASIDNRNVVVDVAAKEVDVEISVQEGPYAKFGSPVFLGLKKVKSSYMAPKIAWKEGSVYDSDLVAKTQSELLKTDLFSSVYITHGDELDDYGQLPMQVRFTESKHSQFSIGAYWATVEGPGATVAWTNRNLWGRGEVLSLDAEGSKKYISGKVIFKKPDFLAIDQSYRLTAQLAREKVYPFLALSYQLANSIERKFNTATTTSLGLKVEHIRVRQSATNGTYFFTGLPLFIKYNGSDDELNPTHGYTLTYSATPYQSLQHARRRFIKQRFTSTLYLPITSTRRFVLALRAQFGSIAGAKREDVPLPKLFFGGTEDDLRGYRYMSVSPIKVGTTEPLGGRSAIFTSLEFRMRFWVIGIVPFADFGTVTNEIFPSYKEKWYKSIGLGLRYHAFFGPVRIDVGIPLDKRGFDPKFQVYASVGQTF